MKLAWCHLGDLGALVVRIFSLTDYYLSMLLQQSQLFIRMPQADRQCPCQL